MTRKKFKIEGMSCGNCIKHIKDALTEDIQGIKVIEVNLENKYATIEVDDSISDEQIKAVIADLGYTVTSIE